MKARTTNCLQKRQNTLDRKPLNRTPCHRAAHHHVAGPVNEDNPAHHVSELGDSMLCRVMLGSQGLGFWSTFRVLVLGLRKKRCSLSRALFIQNHTTYLRAYLYGSSNSAIYIYIYIYSYLYRYTMHIRICIYVYVGLADFVPLNALWGSCRFRLQGKNVTNPDSSARSSVLGYPKLPLVLNPKP